jgi:hypothetical protein
MNARTGGRDLPGTVATNRTPGDVTCSLYAAIVVSDLVPPPRLHLTRPTG